ncbi:MAG: Type secretion needle MxiH, YscF, SsaG, EprI, PscF, EscF [Pseudomonadota bacterium]|nr:Type secretion needle MxiH, YscF, SsaG, EprI, PscF, EscF [Pseudomonadota bacterium]
MAFYAPPSNFTFETVTNTMGNSIGGMEEQMYSQLADLENNPNPSEQDLEVFQANMQIWSNLINMESSIIKVYGDTMKNVVTNMGS